MITEKKFIALFLRHESELKGFAMTLLPCLADAEDVVQEACVAMWKRIEDLEDEGAFRAWAFAFVRFLSLNKIRKHRRSRLVFSEELVSLFATEEVSNEARVRAEHSALAACLEQLPQRQLNLVQRYYAASKLSMGTIAHELGCNPEGLYKNVQRSRAALRECIKKRLLSEGFEFAEG